MKRTHGLLFGSFAALVLVAVTSPLPVRAAGDVTATVNGGGDLVIKGDAESNAIHIAPTGPGAYDVSQGDATTTINGGTSFSATGVTGDVKISMNDGDDTVNIEDTNSEPFPDDLTIRTGDGNDTVDMTDGGVTDDTVISTDKGDDSFVSQATGNGGNLKVRTGTGVDTVSIESGTVSGRTAISTGADNDTVVSSFAQTLSGKVTIRTAGGDDSIDISDTTTGDVTKLNGGGGNDTADVSDPGNSFAVPPVIGSVETVL